jgi:hypothetical protein
MNVYDKIFIITEKEILSCRFIRLSYKKIYKMNKKVIYTAVILGIGVAYCIRLLMGNHKPVKMDAPATY